MGNIIITNTSDRRNCFAEPITKVGQKCSLHDEYLPSTYLDLKAQNFTYEMLVVVNMFSKKQKDTFKEVDVLNDFRNELKHVSAKISPKS